MDYNILLEMHNYI